MLTGAVVACCRVVGIIGQTSRVKYAADGSPVVAAQDKNGGGVIDGVASDYLLSSLTATDFKFSAFGLPSEELVQGSAGVSA